MRRRSAPQDRAGQTAALTAEVAVDAGDKQNIASEMARRATLVSSEATYRPSFRYAVCYIVLSDSVFERSSSKNVGKVSGTNFAVTKVHKNAQKSGAGADDIEDSLPDNVYSDQLRFLKDTVEGRATSGNLDDGKSAQELFHTMTRPRSITPPISPVQESADIEDLFTLEDDVDMSQPSTSSRQSTTSETAGQDPPSQQPQAQSQTNEQGSRKRKQDPLQREIDEVSQRLAKHKPLDEDEYLALSLVPTMKELPKHKKLRMRIEVQEVLESLKQAC
ncbi:hypothetical protein HPB49_013553 [Dermacentor silvarum]|uniref:Uncharacterized protein n=1 Tax=Dermacentor silvarum TaxID=543639 RepID=A0ACB8CFB0_DERSI|nr:hypothetical protein HPB49_013553 [Dermacentor silvarum]